MALLAKDIQEVYGIKLLSNNLNREIFTSIDAENIRNRIENLTMPHRHSTAADVVTISLGVASAVPQKNNNSSSLIRDADKALYNAKQNGCNQVVTFEQL